MVDDVFPRADVYRKQRDYLFAWAVFLLLLVAITIASWIGSYYIFGQPENPSSYRFLRKCGRLEPPRQFELTAAPNGEFLSATKLFERFGVLNPFELQKENQRLIRDYLKNYVEATDLVPYVTGRFSVLEAFELTENDLFTSGAVVLAQSTTQPAVLIELAYTAALPNAAPLRSLLKTGADLRLRRTVDLSAVIHAEKLDDGRLLLTLVPLLYGKYDPGKDGKPVELAPPEVLNLSGSRPIITGERFTAAEQAFLAYRKEAGLELSALTFPGAVASAAARPAPVRKPPTPTPAPTPTPTPTPPPATTGTPSSTVDTAPDASSEHPSAPPPLPAPPADDPPFPTPAPLPRSYLEAISATTAALGGETWQLHKPGEMPRGRLLTVSEMGQLAADGLGDENLYLQGRFIVTASGRSKATLRLYSPGARSAGVSLRAADTTRVIVEYPPGTSPPSEGKELRRKERRPFKIVRVEEGEDGQINVYAREVTTAD